LKIGQHTAKLWARVECPTFLTHGVYIPRSSVAAVATATTIYYYYF